MITIPTIRPETLKGLEADFGTSIASAIWRKIINNHTWVERSLPIGSILFFHASTTDAVGTPIDPPNPNIWLACDGQVVNDVDSPINGLAVPDMLNLFPKGSETESLIGGQETVNIDHDHGGQTGITDDKADFIADFGAERRTGAPHYHTIDKKWSTVEPIIPKFFGLQAYIRYR